MTSMLPPFLAYVFLLLIPLSTASVLSRNGSSLKYRQEAAIPCIAYCDTISCVSQTCSLERRGATAQPPRSDQRTGFHLINLTLSTIQLASTEPQSDLLEKRIFRITAGGAGGRISRTPRYSVNDIQNYLADNLGEGDGGRWDVQYPRQGFYAGDLSMATVTRDNQFGATSFEFGTNGLHGCTMLTIISQRAVWMAHFWEAYAFKDSYDPDAPRKEVNGYWVRLDGDPDDRANLQSWQDRAIAALTGQPIATPLHMPTVGNPINPNLFNRPGDNTEAFFMSPAKSISWDSEGLEVAEYRYPTKLGEMQVALKRLIPGVKITRKAYMPLNYFDPVEMAMRDKSDRGMALFQYDPNADGAGGHYFRLFYESKVWIRKVA